MPDLPQMDVSFINHLHGGELERKDIVSVAAFINHLHGGEY